MKHLKTTFFLILINIVLISMANGASEPDSNRLMASLDGLDAYQALKIANEWRDKNYDVKSSVDTQAVRFVFPNNKKVSIPLPKDRMVVAIAPYINRTHR